MTENNGPAASKLAITMGMSPAATGHYTGIEDVDHISDKYGCMCWNSCCWNLTDACICKECKDATCVGTVHD